MEVLDRRIFSDYSFYKFDDNNNNDSACLIGSYDFSDLKSDEIIKRENYLFQEFVSKCLDPLSKSHFLSFSRLNVQEFELHETNSSSKESVENIYPNFSIIINSKKIKGCKVKGINYNPNNKKRLECNHEEYLELKSKFDKNNIIGTHNFTIDEHKKYNIVMFNDEIKNHYCLSLILETNIATYTVEIGYTQQGRNGGRWRTWFDTCKGKKNGVKELHIGIHFRTKLDGTEYTILEIDDFISS